MDFLEILSDWNFWGKKIHTGFKRPKYLQPLLKLCDLPEIIAIAGIRRSGKSTLLLQLIQALGRNGIRDSNCLFVNFEDPRLPEDLEAGQLFELVSAYTRALKPRGRIYLFLDEIHRVAGWERFVLTLYDQRKNIKIFVTGSSSELLGSSLSHLLSGRHLTCRVTPLDFSEFLSLRKTGKNPKRVRELLKEYLAYGGFPRIVLEKEPLDKRNLLVSYYETILEKDVILKHQIKNKTELQKLARYIFSNTAQLVSTYKLEKILGISNVNIQRYLGHMEEAFLIARIPFFSSSVKKQIYNPDKVFVADLGLANVAGFKLSENRGAALENLVFQKLTESGYQLYYWKNGTEIDLVTFGQNRVQGLINVTETVDDDSVFAREANSLKIGKEAFPGVPAKLVTLYNESGREDEEIIPLFDFLTAPP